MARRDDVDPGLPIKLEPASNGEFVPPPPTPLVREAIRRTRAESDAIALRLGMSRRRFLLSSMGAALGLIVLDGCSKERSGGARPAGSYSLPPQAATESSAAQGSIGGVEAILDVQTHLLDYEHVPDAPDFTGFPQRACGEDDPRLCFGIDHWMEELFLRSDTGMVVLSAVPIVGDADPLSIEVMERAKAFAARLCRDGRVLLQGHAVPNVGRRDAALTAMDELHASHPIAAWKVYTHAPGPGWSFTDETGRAFLDKVSAVAADGGTKIVAVHKGFAGGDTATPADIGPAAAAYPDLDIVVYHSGYESGNVEGAFSDDGKGVDRLVKSLRDAGVRPGSNVHAELGSTWKSVMSDPEQAAHVLGKLLKAVGEDNVVWGTDSIWYGSPQDQIQALRAFEISAEAQERFGYPALTPAVKAKIFGQNSARLYGIDLSEVAGAACTFSADDLERARQETALANRTYGPTTPSEIAASFAADHPWTVVRS